MEQSVLLHILLCGHVLSQYRRGLGPGDLTFLLILTPVVILVEVKRILTVVLPKLMVSKTGYRTDNEKAFSPLRN